MRLIGFSLSLFLHLLVVLLVVLGLPSLLRDQVEAPPGMIVEALILDLPAQPANEPLPPAPVKPAPAESTTARPTPEPTPEPAPPPAEAAPSEPIVSAGTAAPTPEAPAAVPTPAPSPEIIAPPPPPATQQGPVKVTESAPPPTPESSAREVTAAAATPDPTKDVVPEQTQQLPPPDQKPDEDQKPTRPTVEATEKPVDPEVKELEPDTAPYKQLAETPPAPIVEARPGDQVAGLPRPGSKPTPPPAPQPAVETETAEAKPARETPPKPSKPKNDNPLAGILDTASSFKPSQSQPETQTSQLDKFRQQNAAVSSATAPGPLTANEMAALIGQLRQCWNIPAGSQDDKSLEITVFVEVGPDRKVQTSRIVGRQGGGNLGIAAERAERALYDPRCSPLRLPADKFDAWRTMEITFSTRDMFG